MRSSARFRTSRSSESYGLTEGGSPLRAPIDGRPVPRGSPGVPAPDIELRLIDAQGNETEEGELLIRCPYVCLGYYNEPEITRAKLTDGWLRTGDIFCKDKDGFFYFRSRVDDMFSCGGENVYPKEVENLLFAHPDVVNAVVAPVPHPVKGFVPAAMVIARDGATVTRGEAQGLLPRQGAGLFASPLHRHRRHAAAQRRRQDRPRRGAGQAQRRLCRDQRLDGLVATGRARIPGGKKCFPNGCIVPRDAFASAWHWRPPRRASR